MQLKNIKWTEEDEKRYSELREKRDWYNPEYSELSNRHVDYSYVRTIIADIKRLLNGICPEQIGTEKESEQCIKEIGIDEKSLISFEQAYEEMSKFPEDEWNVGSFRDGGSMIATMPDGTSYLFQIISSRIHNSRWMKFLNKVLKSAKEIV